MKHKPDDYESPNWTITFAAATQIPLRGWRQTAYRDQKKSSRKQDGRLRERHADDVDRRQILSCVCFKTIGVRTRMWDGSTVIAAHEWLDRAGMTRIALFIFAGSSQKTFMQGVCARLWQYFMHRFLYRRVRSTG
jgi:hypothetical protein